MIVKLSDPLLPSLIKVEVVRGGITVKSYDGSAVQIEQSDGDGIGTNKGENRQDGGIVAGPSVKEANNIVTITSYTMEFPINFIITVPRHTSLVLSAVNQGDITVSNVEGEVEANNVNGAVTLNNISGDVVAHSLNAAVRVSLTKVDKQKPMAFSSMNGTVDVTFPSDLRADLSLQSGQGKIYSDFDIQLQQHGSETITADNAGGDGKYQVKTSKTIYGTINGGGPEIQFKNFMGNIYIHKGEPTNKSDPPVTLPKN